MMVICLSVRPAEGTLGDFMVEFWSGECKSFAVVENKGVASYRGSRVGLRQGDAVLGKPAV
jgi:hypothetical protein